MKLEKIPAELRDGPWDGLEPDYPRTITELPVVGDNGKYLRTAQKSASGRIIFRWIANQKEAAK